MDAGIKQIKTMFSPNLMPYDATWKIANTINVVGPSGCSVIYDNDYKFGTGPSIQSYNNDPTTPNEFNFGTSLSFIAGSEGPYVIQIPILQDQSPLTYYPHILTVIVTRNGGSPVEIVCTLPTADDDTEQTNMARKKFYVFSGNFGASLGETVNFSFVHQTAVASGSTESTLWIGGIHVGVDNRVLGGFPGIYSEPSNILRLAPVVDFGSTAAGAFTDSAGIVFNGAINGEAVSCGTPVALITGGGEYSAYVSANGFVKVRFRNTTGSTIDPPSSTFNLSITK